MFIVGGLIVWAFTLAGLIYWFGCICTKWKCKMWQRIVWGLGVGLTIIVFVWVSIHIFNKYDDQVHLNKTVTYNMISMSDNSEITGHFVFGSGGIGEQMVYRAYIKSSSGDITLYTCPTDKAVIRYDDSKPPRIEEYYTATVQSWWSDKLKNSQFYLQKIVFFVPTGSVIEQYKMDLE